MYIGYKMGWRNDYKNKEWMFKELVCWKSFRKKNGVGIILNKDDKDKVIEVKRNWR